ncbi:MAG: ArsR family transcriptional regulator [Candidatus Methylarchaceae archaeon HK01M]|nr:ArsR family transcriptional regulator [Candidatus Methylarchaceae archaeon HK01M]
MRDSEVSDITANPARVRILEIIGGEGSASFTEIKRKTSLSTGSIYYHLSYLRDYITRDSNRRYILTEKGRRLLKKLGMRVMVKDQGSFVLKSLSIITLASIFKRATYSRGRAIAVTISTLALGSFVCLYSNLNHFLLSVPSKLIMNPILSTFLTGWLLTFVLAELYSAITTGIKVGGEVELATTIALSFIPLYIYSSITHLQISNIILVPMQIWSAILLAGGLNISKGVRLTHSFIFSLIILYLSIYIWLTI